jgi:hypothetical protein
VLLLLAMAAAVAWMLKAYDAGSLGGASLGNATASPWQPQAPPTTRATPLELPPPSAGRAEMAQPEPPAPPLKPKPAARAPASPREACGRRERYALLQCMESQCAKKAWTQHEQCVRLRKDRKL